MADLSLLSLSGSPPLLTLLALPRLIARFKATKPPDGVSPLLAQVIKDNHPNPLPGSQPTEDSN